MISPLKTAGIQNFELQYALISGLTFPKIYFTITASPLHPEIARNSSTNNFFSTITISDKNSCPRYKNTHCFYRKNKRSNLQKLEEIDYFEFVGRNSTPFYSTLSPTNLMQATRKLNYIWIMPQLVYIRYDF